MQVTVRTADVGDEPFLWTMLLEAAHVGDEVPDIETLKRVPDLARYVEGWGRSSDVGMVATVDGDDGRPVGAAWARLIAAYGFVDSDTPELAIAVDPSATGSGIGTQLLERLLAAAEPRFPALSLSVRADNPARRLYERFGFVAVDGLDHTNRAGGTSLTMVRRFT